MKTSKFFIKLSVYFIVYVLSFVVVRQFDHGSIVFYQGNFIIMVLSSVFVAFDCLKAKSLEVACVNLPVYFSFAVLSFAFLTTFPVILDRSITLHMYNYLAQNPGKDVASIRSNFIDEFIFEHEGIQKRIIEQQALGNVYVDNELVYLSDSGNKSYVFFQFLNKLFNIRPTY